MAKPKKPRDRLKWRGSRAYGDFRDYAHVGGGFEALRPAGATRATTDEAEAHALIATRLRDLDQRRFLRGSTHGDPTATLGEKVREHLAIKRDTEDVTEGTLDSDARALDLAIAYFGARRALGQITPSDISKWVAHLKRTLKPRKGAKPSNTTVRHYINSLSNLYRTAQQEGWVPLGHNPVAALKTKPQIAKAGVTKWFEVDEAALLLEAARLYRSPKGRAAAPWLYPFVGVQLLTGARLGEVFRLTPDDISFDRELVTIKGTKTEHADRTVPLVPQLREILAQYVANTPPDGLLFPSRVGQVATKINKQLDALGAVVGLEPGRVRNRVMRVTFTAAALQTLDNGHPIATFTVAKWLGHGGTRLVERVYGRLGTIRHRSECVEYRVEQHLDHLGERLAALRAHA